MSNELRNFRLVYLKIQEDVERLSRTLKPSYSSIYEQMERVFEPIRQQHLKVARSIMLSGLSSPRMTQIIQANQRWQDLIDQITASTRIFEDLTHAHWTWLDAIKPMQDSTTHLQAVTKLSIGNIAYRLMVTERLFAGIDFDTLNRTVALPKSVFLKLESVIDDIALAYGKLVESICTCQDITRLPISALSGATREIFTTGHVVNVFCVSNEVETEENSLRIQFINEVETETSICGSLLEAVDPALVRPYMGAHTALHGTNPDRTRHILSSLRELWNHLLRCLAPDEYVLAWVSGSENELLHNGRPTRRARVLYIFRNLNHDPLADFIIKDTHALVELVNFFNRVHELKLELTDEQLRALLLRTDSWVTYILQIWKEIK